MKRKTGKEDAIIATMIVPTKVPGVYTDPVYWVIEGVLMLFVLLSYIPIVYRTVYRITFEKASRAKETMRIMGMSNLPYWCSWFVIYTLSNTIIVTCMWGILFINVVKTNSAMLLWIILWLFGQSLFPLILVTQALFQTPRSAAILTTMSYFGMTITNALLLDEECPRNFKLGCCFFFPTVSMC